MSTKKPDWPRGRNRRNEARVRDARRFDPQDELLYEKYDRQLLEWMEAEATGEWG